MKKTTIILLYFFVSIMILKAQAEVKDSIINSIQLDSIQLRSAVPMADTRYIPNIPNVVLPTPESQKFMKYGNHEPSLATGTVNISVPFYQINIGNFSLPISFQYATNGIKPEDSPHPMGYGWILQPALRITRILMGRNDFSSRRSTCDVAEMDFSNFKQEFLYLKSTLTKLNDNYPSDWEYTNIDSKVDIFTIHLPDEKINFVLEKEGDKWIGITDGSFAKIEATERQIIVKDEKGITYIFGGDDSCLEKRTYYSNGNPQLYISAWGLKKIILPNNNIVLFDWEAKSRISRSFKSHSESWFDFHSWVPMNFYLHGYEIDDDLSQKEPIMSHSTEEEICKTLQNILIKKIYFPLGTVDFNYMNNSNCTLNEIKVSSNLNLVKKVCLEYNTEGDLLNNLIVSGEGRYSFEYNPQRFSFFQGNGSTGYYVPQDYWGYYNGEGMGLLVPKMIVLTSTSGINYYAGGMSRKVDGNFIKANILEKVTYPLGGTTEFKYETHKFLGRDINTLCEENPGISHISYKQLTEGGGVRLSQMITKDSPTAPAVIKTYKYGDTMGTNEEQAKVDSYYTGYGIVPAEPTLDTFVDEGAAVTISTMWRGTDFEAPLYVTRRVLSFSSQSYIWNYMLFEPNVWYDKVTEFQNDDIKTVYKYEYENSVKNAMSNRTSSAAGLPALDWTLGPNYGPNGRQLRPQWALGEGQSFFNPRYPYQLNTISAPNLVEKIKYVKVNNFFNKIQREQIEYDYHLFHEFNNLEVLLGIQNHLNYSGPCNCNCETELSPHFTWTDLTKDSFKPCRVFSGNIYGAFDSYSGGFYDSYSYQLQFARLFPRKEIVTVYNTNGAITNTTEYNYVVRENKKILKGKITSIGGTGNTLNEEFLYPWEDLSALSPEQMSTASDLINSNRMTTPVQYEKKINGSVISKKIITYKDYGNGLILPQKENYSTKADTGQVRIIYHEYDAKGNPLYITKDGGTKIVYIWSYEGQYPVAEIKNASYEEVLNVLNTNQLVMIQNVKNPADETLEMMGDLLRTNLPYAFVTTYKYRPLIGINEITDPSGITTYYEYDSLGRLKRTYLKDESNQEKTLQIYDYNYHDQ